MTDPDDSKLFRDSVGPVRRVKNDTVAPHRPAPKPEPRQARADERAVIGELLAEPAADAGLETGEELHYARSGVQKRVLRRLRRGQYSVGDAVDLHFMNEDTARAVLEDFIADNHRAGVTCVKVIHGKGLGSRPGGPVLKRMVSHRLRRHPAVVAFTSARPRDGGTGAVYVLLKR